MDLRQVRDREGLSSGGVSWPRSWPHGGGCQPTPSPAVGRVSFHLLDPAELSLQALLCRAVSSALGATTDMVYRAFASRSGAVEGCLVPALKGGLGVEARVAQMKPISSTMSIAHCHMASQAMDAAADHEASITAAACIVALLDSWGWSLSHAASSPAAYDDRSQRSACLVMLGRWKLLNRVEAGPAGVPLECWVGAAAALLQPHEQGKGAPGLPVSSLEGRLGDGGGHAGAGHHIAVGPIGGGGGWRHPCAGCNL
eukprot:CAMPEP_0117696534 /NCGR_PEP_ID=MMETSP0804-20121206/28727_1 /TAXON_ID=1074897 /ORGANISM="Tetraselmis astigmatica, Strain CCMP880" /LENGTH=255 /DNA_ID=CAMNT_0005510685 /DNA_START=584 /DNA_END=1353 /DNA_ORIENTATION=+